jgi:hypothetical protein
MNTHDYEQWIKLEQWIWFKLQRKSNEVLVYDYEKN